MHHFKTYFFKSKFFTLIFWVSLEVKVKSAHPCLKISPYILGGESHEKGQILARKLSFFHFFSKNLVWHLGRLRHHKDFDIRGR